MTELAWTFDRQFPDIEYHPYRPALVTEPQPAPCPFPWRLVGRLMAGALWGGIVAGLVARWWGG